MVVPIIMSNLGIISYIVSQKLVVFQKLLQTHGGDSKVSAILGISFETEQDRYLFALPNGLQGIATPRKRLRV